MRARVSTSIIQRSTQEKTYRIPALDGGETLSAAARVRAGRDVVERGGTLGVKHGVEEAERALALVEERIVEERDDGGEGRARRGGAVNALELAVDLDRELHALGGDVGERAARGIEEAGVRVAELGEVRRDGVRLVRGLRKDVREAARGERRRGLRVDTLGASHRGQADVGDGQNATFSSHGKLERHTRGNPRGRSERTGRHRRRRSTGGQKHHRHQRQRERKCRERRAGRMRCTGY